VTYDAVIDVANPDLKLKPGMTATVSVVTDRRRDVLAVPNAALRFRPDGAPAGGAAAGAPGAGQRQRGQGGENGGKWRHDREDGAAGEDGGPPPVVKRTLYVLVDDKPVAREVTTGITDGRLTEITGGDLKEGELVITGAAGQQGQQGQRGGGQNRPAGPRIL